MHDLAFTYQKQNRWDEAEKLFTQVMKTRLKVLNAEHPGTVNSMYHLAVTYRNQGRRNEAIALMQKVFDTKVKFLGSNHPDTLDSIEKLRLWSGT